ncbi:MAG TPA: GTPase HflX [Candidatus Babeliales bacterium]|nr:GTPase HflX [Candidatus Babeliales bacterium]
MKKQATTTVTHPKTLLLGIQTPDHYNINMESYFEEFRNLARTNEVHDPEELFIKIRTIDPGYFLTKGKRDEIKTFCDEHEIEEVIISETLSSRQAGNLSELLDCNIFDRTELILEIFEKSAHTAEGKMQVAIAQLQHKKSRLSGKGIHFGQQSGAIGVRGGFGETAKEKETRHIEDSILQLKRHLNKMHSARETQRKQRLSSGEPNLCLIGYTNAGKSTILNILTNSNVLAEDKLFATLDTTTRSLFIDGNKKGTISDTVGFIQQLPPRLIDAFKSTLSELHHADLLLHVIDISDSGWENHIRIVHDILTDLKVETPMLYVFNKADKIDTTLLIGALERYEPHVIVSSLSKKGIAPLIHYIKGWMPH